jgi:hypothetical protein
MLREGTIEEMVTGMLTRLVCPSSSIIDWVAESMRSRRQEDIEGREKLVVSIQAQLDRIGRMEDCLYDDKLSGDITADKYKEKHEQLIDQKVELNSRLEKIDRLAGPRLEHRLVLLDLSQKAADLYPGKTPEQKRLIMSKLFSSLTIKGGILSVKYTRFAETIANNVQITRNIMEAK